MFLLLEVRAPTPMTRVLAVVVLPNALLSKEELEGEDTQLEEVWFHSPSKLVGEVTVLVVGVAVRHNSSLLKDPLNTKVEEGVGLPSKEVVGAMEVVEAVEEGLSMVDHPDHLIPSCTKQPNLFMGLHHLRQVLHPDPLSMHHRHSRFTSRKKLAKQFSQSLHQASQ